jgi:ferredoxin
MDWLWQLQENSCTGCGICYDVCPEGAIKMTRDMALPEAIPNACTGCMVCVEACPFDAIEVKEK